MYKKLPVVPKSAYHYCNTDTAPLHSYLCHMCTLDTKGHILSQNLMQKICSSSNLVSKSPTMINFTEIADKNVKRDHK